MSEVGEIYVLVNAATPGLVKVGKTRNESAYRAAQLSASTGIPEPFEIVRRYEVVDVDAAEFFAHKVLERTNGRPNANREFFLGPVDRVIEVLDQALLRYVRPADDLPVSWRLALEKVKANQPSLALAEFEFAIRQGEIPFEHSVWSDQVVDALGAYAACCCFLQRQPSVSRYFTNIMHKHRIGERMIEFLTLFQVDDPTMRAIVFLRGLS